MLFIDTLPYGKIILYTMLLTCATCLQTLSTMFIYYRYKYRRKNYWRVALEVTISIYLLSLLLFTAESYYHMTAGFYTIKSYSIIKWFITGLLLLFSIGSYKTEKKPQIFMFPILSSFSLPIIESLLGRTNGFFYIAFIIFWNLIEIEKFISYYRLKRKQLSAFSAKEAIDRLDFGLMYFRSTKKQKGKIILENEKMQELTYKITGKTVINGIDFLRTITGFKEETLTISSPTILILPDSSIWSFRLEPVYSEGEKYFLLIASDITNIYMVTEDLIIKNKKLSEKNRKLEKVFRNMDDICKSEEILKGRVFIHDTLGQKISILLRAIREKRVFNKEELNNFIKDFRYCLNNPENKIPYSFDEMIKVFNTINVNITVNGKLPKNKIYRKIFYNTAKEAVTNAVRHGYASKIDIQLIETDDAYSLSIINNGYLPTKPLKEGGGISEMRRKVVKLGGSFSYSCYPKFKVTSVIYKELQDDKSTNN